jgi:hypothetical protein
MCRVVFQTSFNNFCEKVETRKSNYGILISTVDILISVHMLFIHPRYTEVE